MKNPLRALAGWIDPARPVGLAPFLVLTGVVVLLDQLTKLAAVAWLDMHAPGIVIIPNFFNLYLTTNPGAAFSIAHGQTLLLTLFSSLVTMVLVIWAWRLPPAEHGIRIPLGLIVGGAIGNLIDRVRLGEVIDFLDAHWFWKAHWPTFNVADSAICVGVGIWLIATWQIALREKAEAKTRQSPPSGRPGQGQ